MSRRRVLRGVALAPLALPAAGLSGCGEPEAGPSLSALEGANALHANPLSRDRLARILPAARHNHAFFAAVRALEIPDTVEPSVRFSAAVNGATAEGDNS